MPQLNDLLTRLWDDYTAFNPHALKIHELLKSRGETIRNDHIALRTFGDKRIGMDVLGEKFVNLGYEPRGFYTFTEKHLYATHYEHPDAAMPKVFVSELRLDVFGESLRSIVADLVDQVPAELPRQWDLPVAGRPWEISIDDYETLRGESEYAAWVAAFGFRANHFTIDVNALSTFASLQELNAFLKASGFALNTAGGEIKGSPDDYLEQSSTLAGEVEVEFTDGRKTIPACYYEFARRYKMPNGKLFTGFVAKSADKIFQSTDRR
jgi:hypothetical protein